MDRRDFLKVLGVVSVAPVVVAKALESGPVVEERPMTATRVMMDERDRLYFSESRSGKMNALMAENMARSLDDHIYDCMTYSMQKRVL